MGLCPSVSICVRYCPSLTVCVHLCPSVYVCVRLCMSVPVCLCPCPSVSICDPKLMLRLIKNVWQHGHKHTQALTPQTDPKSDPSEVQFLKDLLIKTLIPSITVHLKRRIKAKGKGEESTLCIRKGVRVPVSKSTGQPGLVGLSACESETYEDGGVVYAYTDR